MNLIINIIINYIKLILDTRLYNLICLLSMFVLFIINMVSAITVVFISYRQYICIFFNSILSFQLINYNILCIVIIIYQ